MLNILIVDDDPRCRRIYDLTTRERGHNPLLAANGLEALEKVRGNGIDLMVLDMEMPVMDGVGVLCGLKEMESRVPVIVNSSVNMEIVRKQATGTGYEQIIKYCDNSDPWYNYLHLVDSESAQ